MAKTSRPSECKKKKVGRILRGEIYLCSFNPIVGHEISKMRPALIIQNDIGNRYSPLTIVAAITSAISPVPYLVEVIIEPTTGNGLAVRSSIRLDQIRTVDRRCLVSRLGVIDATTMVKVDEALKISLNWNRI